MTIERNSPTTAILALMLSLYSVGLVPIVSASNDAHDHSGHDKTPSEHHDDHDSSSHEAPESERDHPHEDAHGDAHGKADSVELGDAQIELAKLKIVRAGGGTLRNTLQVYGRIEPIASRTAVVRARYPGQIVRLDPDIGERVSRGDVVATIEADDSLRRYSLRAPITGVVVDRMASAGEATADRVLLRIADYSAVWAQIAVFPSQQSSVSVGQAVVVRGDGVLAEGVIDWIAPTADLGPARRARVVLPNANGRWAPESTVRAEIATDVSELDLLVENAGVQEIEGRPSVFVRDGNRFEVHPLSLGRSDGHMTEVLSGLEPGAEYVTANSYLLKAELEKSSAEHDH